MFNAFLSSGLDSQPCGSFLRLFSVGCANYPITQLPITAAMLLSRPASGNTGFASPFSLSGSG
jgi:hypothetical protein